MNPKTNQRRLLEALEACRPGSDDISDLSMASLAECVASDPQWEERRRCVESLDEAVGTAFRAVEVPEGLAERILDRLELLPVASPMVESKAEASGEDRPSPQFAAYRVSRGWLVAGLSSVAVAAALLLVGFFVMRSQPLDGRSLDEQVIAFYISEGQQQALSFEDAPPNDRPWSSLLALHSDFRWRRVDEFLGRSAVAYETSGPRGGRAVLYVLSGPATGLSDHPPARPFWSQGLSVAAWREAGLVYVLVVEGGEQDYRQFLGGSEATLT